MKTSARIQAVIDLTNRIEEARIPMDSVCGDYFRVHVGSPSKARASASHWFLLAADEAGALKLLGVQY